MALKTFVHSSLVGLLGLVFCASFSTARAAENDDLIGILEGSGAQPTATKEEAAKAASLLTTLIKDKSVEAQAFLAAFEKGDYQGALLHWTAAFKDGTFAKTANGKAFYALLLVKNGLPINGIETLFSITDPKEISPVLIGLWKESVNEANPAWAEVKVTWRPEWTEIFGVATEVRVTSRTQYGPEQIEALKEAIKKTTLNTRERALLEWQLVLALSLRDQAGPAAKILAHLMKAPNNPVSVDLMTITAARLLFQNGYLDAASAYYAKIPKASDYWLDAQEEMAWTEMRKGQPQNVLALTKTINNPALVGQVGPEPLMLQSLAQLKVCDYPGVERSVNAYRERFRERALKMQALKDNPATPAVNRFIKNEQAKDLKLTDLGIDARALPRYVTRDYILQDLINSSAALKSEEQVAANLASQAAKSGALPLAAGAGHYDLTDLTSAATARATMAKNAIYDRVKTLAEEDLSEIVAQLQKMHIVETEVIQNVSLAEKRIAASKTAHPTKKLGTTGSKAGDRLTFPAEKEIWFDELSNFKVDVSKGCQVKETKAVM